MKILYVKNNSERAKAFQLRTTIYEIDGQKFVKKEAIHNEAIAHLKKMKTNYTKLSDAIINPNIKLAPILEETENSLTFAFIEGTSLEQKYNTAKKLSPSAAEAVSNEYVELVKNGFKTTIFNSNTMLTDTHKTLFGVSNCNTLNGEVCFDGISNIDLIFSNIIFQDKSIYLIDYEWVFDCNIPIEYGVFRALHDDGAKWLDTETHFLDHYVIGQKGFHNIKEKYMHKKTHVKNQQTLIQELNDKLQSCGDELTYAQEVIRERDIQLEASRLKNRAKVLMRKVIPEFIRTPLHDLRHAYSTRNAHKGPKIYRYETPTLTNKIEKEITLFTKQPKISIIMPVYNISPQWLKLAIDSIEAQWYTNWELCIADDKSTNNDTLVYLKSLDNPKIKVTYLEQNSNISAASNAALDLAEGEYIVLMDNDDEITPDALYEMVKVINTTDAEFIYSDEDFNSTEGVCSNPHFKADFSPDLLLSHNYITHLTCFSKVLLDKVGHFNSQYDGAQDYDLFLRLTEATNNIYHIPKVLYHWRTLETSTSANSEAKPEAINRGKQLIEDTLARRGINASVVHANLNHYFRVQYAIEGEPLVSIVIPFKDKPELLDMCINSILDKSSYKNYEIIGISNNSEESETFKMMKSLEAKDNRVSFYEYNVDFSYSDINNHAVNSYVKGTQILLLNNDIEIISPDWIESMLEHSQRPEIGCVGAKLYYPNDTIQHAGIIIGLGGYAGHSHKMYPRDNPGYFNRLNVIQNLSAVTAACMMVKKDIYIELGGLDNEAFKIAYNDVDFCLRVREKGFLNIFTPYAQMYHHESLSRGYEDTAEKIARFNAEKISLDQRHGAFIKNGDPYYNPNLSLDTEDFSLC